MQTAAFPGTSQNVNSEARDHGFLFLFLFFMLYFAIQHPELGNGSEKMNCECSMDKGRLSKCVLRDG